MSVPDLQGPDRPGTGAGRGALEGKGPQTRPQRRLDGRLEEVAKAVGGGYCRLQTPLRPALGVRETVAGHWLGAQEGGGGLPHFQCVPGRRLDRQVDQRSCGCSLCPWVCGDGIREVQRHRKELGPGPCRALLVETVCGDQCVVRGGTSDPHPKGPHNTTQSGGA